MLKRYYSLFLSLLFIPGLFSQTLNTGFNSAATKKAGVDFRNFKSGGGSEVYLGTYNFSVKTEITDITWTGSQHVKFTYNSSTGVIGANVATSPAKSTTYSIGNLGEINYIEIELVGGQSQTTVKFDSIKINSSVFTGNSLLAPANKNVNITDVNLTNEFTIEGNLVMTGSQPGGDGNYLIIRVGYLVPPDNQAPVVTGLTAVPNYAEVGTNILVYAKIDDSGTGNSNIKSAEYSLDSGDWTAMSGTFNSPVDSVYVTLSGLSCGLHSVCVRGTDIQNNTSTSSCTNIQIYEKGSLSGTVLVNGFGVGGVIVKLLSLDGETIIDTVTTMSLANTPAGHYEFDTLVPGDYRVMIVLPIGYSTTDEQIDFNIPYCDNDVTQNFTLEPIPIVNSARSKGYWKNQFDVYISKKGKAQETSAGLTSYIDRIVSNYITHYDLIFANNYDFKYWSDILNYGGPDMYKKAVGQLAALVLNMASLKISQSEVVTLDGRDVADVITFASEVLSNSASTAAQQEVVKNACEFVNTQLKIAAGVVPDYNILYKDAGTGNSLLPKEFSISNYPNPFNPSTVITYALPEAGYVTLKIYDVLGKEVATLVNGKTEAGYHNISFDAKGMTSGIYLYVIKTDRYYSAKKMMFIK